MSEDKCGTYTSCTKLAAVLDDDHSRTRRIWFSSFLNLKTGKESTVLVIRKKQMTLKAKFCPFCGVEL